MFVFRCVFAGKDHCCTMIRWKIIAISNLTRLYDDVINWIVFVTGFWKLIIFYFLDSFWWNLAKGASCLKTITMHSWNRVGLLIFHNLGYFWYATILDIKKWQYFQKVVKDNVRWKLKLDKNFSDFFLSNKTVIHFNSFYHVSKIFIKNFRFLLI